MQSSAFLQLSDIWKSFKIKKQVIEVLKGVSLDVNKGEFVVILGPSGEGKTTLLRIISGLEVQDKGEVYIDGERVDNIPPKDRNVAMVFQNYAIYPFMSVFDNIAFPLKLKKLPKQEIAKKVREVAELLQIEKLLDRKPYQLSGGQKQRVAIARALVKGAQLLLMDEPLANLDAQIRMIAREELKELQRKLGFTVVYVTHDQTEALALADRVALLRKGVLQAYDKPMKLFKRPNNIWVASFLGNPPMNLLKVKVDEGAVLLDEYKIEIPSEISEKLKGRSEVIMGIRPEDIDIGGKIKGSVELTEPLGLFSVIHVKIREDEIRVVTNSSSSYVKGDTIQLAISGNKALFFDESTGELIT
ncbi:ABC transporter ATP-binding protein [Sulfolobus acidocaldarius]|uniref:ABC transporter ATPase component n=5 Tax=Sulfolobus acidocaldarius TaxID=2285 RepID=Q4J9L5_SULAC|nr:ABC transporter ATP-binding protein [Sulfolobus acidocaldarius]AAY80513.1 ABC transporter ATPase component [Sulfolobus acidocaldarius DSM 639]AGE71102.1 ABC transporter ATPase component [Sulfolobus acidocaldarius N8]AGE73373.1 ABC transporter ATPase component [Sulfolobus acidocaldarius Ron12/I]ALU31337.1 ABC transporter [Sulfolobus acidocaldarius]WCM35039.1 ATP-binding cassette domain-containing protein [Sulfolobus acidocaldarius DSM 639]